MNTKTVFDRLQSIDDEVQKLHNTIFALKTTDIQAYADKYEELSISAALRSERIACQLRNLVYTTTDTGKKDYLKQAAAVQGIKISFSNSVLSITMPGLLPKRKLRTNTAFLHEPLNLALQTYVTEGKLPVAVHILADELANTGAILELNKKISVIRSRNLSISCIFQNLPQMQNRYPYNQWQEIIGNCDTQLFLGCTDEVTATFISNRSGDVTVGVSSEAKQLNSWRVSDYTPEYRQTKSIGKRKLLTPDEILRLPLDTALVILRGQKVLKVEKYDYTLHPDAKKLTPRKASEHIPEWRKNGSSEETDYRPQPSFESAKRKRRSSSASIAKQKPHFTSEPVYQEPTPDDFMEDLLQENFIEDSPDSGMVPLDKDSIMS